ncbi:histidine phosphotransferase [Maritimibacter sp. 55A14]|uniref:histidine phosphotransferase family protein n=1 Tax=Maritimibacter sp. 55A14 TaxID=2174844 RepID=UPI000D610B98|nr:histidine phosphotransferase family protein [Maritimibacter sp. 55A14]PWE33057.1 histidine phosphotransferase [Maritimibacter sp. 55A14]
MPADSTELAALLGSRICHDLISPLGAIGNGLELLELGGVPQSPEMSLIAQSVSHANARIRFFRIAFGMAVPDATLARNDLARIIDESFGGSRIGVIWEPRENLPRMDVKLAFLALMCLEGAMPYGGEIRAMRGPAGWRVVARAEKFRIRMQLWQALTDPHAEVPLTPADVHFGLLRELGSAHRPALAAEITEGAIEVRF